MARHYSLANKAKIMRVKMAARLHDLAKTAKTATHSHFAALRDANKGL